MGDEYHWGDQSASQEQASGIVPVIKIVMQMDQPTQQNVGLVEEATSASQSMKQQTAALLDQVSFFKFEDTRKGCQVRTSEMSSSATVHPQRKPHIFQGSRAFQVEKSRLSHSQPGKLQTAGVGVTKGQDRQQGEGHFSEEF